MGARQSTSVSENRTVRTSPTRSAPISRPRHGARRVGPTSSAADWAAPTRVAAPTSDQLREPADEAGGKHAAGESKHELGSRGCPAGADVAPGRDKGEVEGEVRNAAPCGGHREGDLPVRRVEGADEHVVDESQSKSQRQDLQWGFRGSKLTAEQQRSQGLSEDEDADVCGPSHQ